MAAVVLLAQPALDGCLVLSDPDFQGEESCTPSFVAQEADPPQAGTSRFPANPGDPLEFRGTVPMKSCALVKNYDGRVFLDGELKTIIQIPPNGEDVRDVAVLLSLSEVPPGCHEVELYVSQLFSSSPTDLKTPARAGDLAYFVWRFVNTSDPTDALTCGQPR